MADWLRQNGCLRRSSLDALLLASKHYSLPDSLTATVLIAAFNNHLICFGTQVLRGVTTAVLFQLPNKTSHMVPRTTTQHFIGRTNIFLCRTGFRSLISRSSIVAPTTSAALNDSSAWVVRVWYRAFKSSFWKMPRVSSATGSLVS